MNKLDVSILPLTEDKRILTFEEYKFCIKTPFNNNYVNFINTLFTNKKIFGAVALINIYSDPVTHNLTSTKGALIDSYLGFELEKDCMFFKLRLTNINS